jgi:hypothetical protein
MKIAIIVALLCLAVVAGLGLVAQAKPAASRPKDLTVAVSDAWYGSLPRDPVLATQAFFDRVPLEMRERGEQVSQSGVGLCFRPDHECVLEVAGSSGRRLRA